MHARVADRVIIDPTTAARARASLPASGAPVLRPSIGGMVQPLRRSLARFFRPHPVQSKTILSRRSPRPSRGERSARSKALLHRARAEVLQSSRRPPTHRLEGNVIEAGRAPPILCSGRIHGATQ